MTVVFSGFAETDTEFRANHFTRDLRTKTEHGRGKAYLKQGGKEIWADEIEYNFDANKLTAVGDVHIRERGVDIFCARGVYSMKDETALLEEASILAGQMVLSGSRVRKIAPNRFEMEEGFYTNCNNELLKTKDAAKCIFDWKIYARTFDITIESYFYAYDVIVYTKDLPAFYLPFYMAPVKTKRQSGLLLASIATVGDLGAGFRLPYYHVLGSWHDMTLDPTYYPSYGKGSLHLGTEYRYIYGPGKQGRANLYLSTNPLSSDRSPTQVRKAGIGPRTLGFGAFAADIQNEYWLGGRSHTRQSILYASDPYFPVLYEHDLGNISQLGFLRSQVNLTIPSDDYLVTGAASYHQSILLPDVDTGIDQGPPAKLPAIGFHKKAESLIGNVLNYEFNSAFTNFYRKGNAYDNVPGDQDNVPNKEGPFPAESNEFDANDYLREGRRLELEPKLVLNFPFGTGFQLQPTLRAKEVLYQFDKPNTQVVHRGYADVTVPLSMYVAKNFDSFRHVFQPKFIFSSSLLKVDNSKHNFFTRTPDLTKLSNPRWDINDDVSDFQYYRIELSNRFLFRENSQRFLLFELANQYNANTNPYDPRFRNSLGPIEFLLQFDYASFSAQFYGDYQLRKVRATNNELINESNWFGKLVYTKDNDSLALTTSVHRRKEQVADEQTFIVTASKELPIYLTIGGGLEYSARHGSLRAYNFNIGFAQRPNTCWTLNLNYARNANGISTTLFNFGILLGGPTGVTPVGI